MKTSMPRGAWSGFAGKKMLIVFPIVALLAAGCGKSATSSPTAQNNGSQSQQNSQPQAAQQPPVQASPKASAGQFKTIDVPAPAAAYSSTVDGFTVNFPSVPKITKSTAPSPTAGPIPVTEYRKLFSSGSEYAFYTVSVYHYPSTFKLTSDYLSTGLQTFTKILTDLFPGTEIASQQSAKFLGNPSLTGTLSVPVKLTSGSTATTDTGDYFTATIKGQNIYIISAYGMDQSNYNAFLNSFKFAQ
jgi:hypothetical protein